jgi:hypothetical protein
LVEREPEEAFTTGGCGLEAIKRVGGDHSEPKIGQGLVQQSPCESLCRIKIVHS